MLSAGSKCALLLLSILPHTAVAGEYYWPMQKGDANRTGYSQYVVTSDLSKPATWRWEDPHSEVIRATPLIDGKKNIYLGTIGGRIYKFSPDGAIIWTYRSRRGKTPTVSALMEGSVYLNTAYGFVVALDMETGKERWATQIAREIETDTACVFAINKTIISAAKWVEKPYQVNHAVIALNDDGTHRWTFGSQWPLFNFQASSPGDGTVLFQDQAGGLYRLRLGNGEVLWESGIRDRREWFFSTAGGPVLSPNGLVYIASNDHVGGVIHAYRLEDGSPVWRRDLGMPANQGVAYGVLAGDSRPAVIAGIGENPSLPWINRLSSYVPQWLRKLINAASVASAGRPTWLWGTKELPALVVALEAETGAMRWSYKPPPFTRPSCEGDEALLFKRYEAQDKFPDFPIDPVCFANNWAQAVIGGDGTAYLGHQDGKLYAVRDANGNAQIEESEVSTHYFAAAFQGPQAIAPGMLAVAPCGGGLWVWRS